MAAPVRIEAEAWSDLRFATLARLMGFADLDHALIKVSRIWSWQTEHYTTEAPTYVVDVDIVESALGAGGAAAMVRAKLADETPDGLRIRGTEGKIEWLYHRRRSSEKGGEATKRKHSNKGGPGGLANGLAGSGPEAGPKQGPLPLALSPDQEDLSRAIPPSTEQAPAPAPTPAQPPQAAAQPVPELRLNAPLPAGASEHRALWRELEQARAESAAALGVAAQPLVFGDAGERDLANMLAAARARGPAELNKLVGQARHAIAMAKLETVSGEKPIEWFTGAVFSPNNFRRLVGKTLDDAKPVRAGPHQARGDRYRERTPEQPRKTQIL